MKLDIGRWYLGVRWCPSVFNRDRYLRDFYIFHWLDRDARYWGYEREWYDGYHYSLGLWWFNITWKR